MTEEEGAELENDNYKELYEKAQIVTGLFFYPTFCLFGLVGNGLSVFVLSRKRMRSATNAFLLALSISDIIKLLVDSVYFVDILLQITDRKTGEKTYAIVYPYAHYFFHMSVCTTAWLTVSVAAERYLIVMRSNRVCTVLRARLISVVVFLSTIVLMIPVGLRYRTNAVVETAGNLNATVLNVEVTELWRGKTFATVYTLLETLFRSIIPCVILCSFNCYILLELRKTGQVNGRQEMTSSPATRRITLMLVSIIAVFLVCHTPDAIMSAFLGLGYHDASYLIRAVREVTDLLLTVCSAINFLFYCTFNQAFRKEFLAIFGKEMQGNEEYRPSLATAGDRTAEGINLKEQDPGRQVSSGLQLNECMSTSL